MNSGENVGEVALGKIGKGPDLQLGLPKVKDGPGIGRSVHRMVLDACCLPVPWLPHSFLLKSLLNLWRSRHLALPETVQSLVKMKDLAMRNINQDPILEGKKLIQPEISKPNCI